MPKPNVLFIAAESRTSAGGEAGRSVLHEDVQRIREKVRAAESTDDIEFDVRSAVHVKDLLTALHETQPDVVDFSRCGQEARSTKLRQAIAGGAALAKLFAAFGGGIRVVVLDACSSPLEAEAVAEVVGCVIRTLGSLSDESEIAFRASFYRALAFGNSVGTAFDQARMALALEHVDKSHYPQLVVRHDVNPARLVLIPSSSVALGAEELTSETSLTWEIKDLASRVWENGEDAETFLSTPHALLDGLTPRAAARTAVGRDRVRRILLALEYGLPV